MPSFLNLIAIALALVAFSGIAQAVAGYLSVRRFSGRLTPCRTSLRPPMTILKPLCGDEPLLEEALASICAIDYPDYQVVFGVQNPADPAVAVVARLRARFPAREISLVVDDRLHGKNRKIGNLMNMLPTAKHALLVIGDSDVHVMPDYLDRIAAELAIPGTGLVTTIYTGVPANNSLPAVLGASSLSYSFLPGALMARALGRQDTLGATMALRRDTLDAIGGFAALVDHLADDHVLGHLVQDQGLAVRLAATITATTVPESAILALFRHELRWSRTVLSLVPREFALSAIQFPLFWSALAVCVSGVEDWAVAVFLATWAARAFCAIGIDHALALSRRGLAAAPPVWLLPLRDLLSIAVMLASYGGDQVEWRGRVISTGRAPGHGEIAYSPQSNAPAPSAG